MADMFRFVYLTTYVSQCLLCQAMPENLANLLLEVQIPQHLLNIFGGVLVPTLRLHNDLVLPDIRRREQPRASWGS